MRKTFPPYPIPMKNILLSHINSMCKTQCDFRQLGRPRKMTNEYILDRIFYVLKTGCQWSALHVKSGSYKTIWAYFDRWTKLGVFERAFYDSVRWYKKVNLRKRLSCCVIDTSFVKNVFGQSYNIIGQLFRFIHNTVINPRFTSILRHV